MIGADPWPYGPEHNRVELDQFLAYDHDQGLTRQRLAPEDLFDPPVRDFRFQAKLPIYGAEPASIVGF